MVRFYYNLIKGGDVTSPSDNLIIVDLNEYIRITINVDIKINEEFEIYRGITYEKFYEKTVSVSSVFWIETNLKGEETHIEEITSDNFLEAINDFVNE